MAPTKEGKRRSREGMQNRKQRRSLPTQQRNPTLAPVPSLGPAAPGGRRLNTPPLPPLPALSPPLSSSSLCSLCCCCRTSTSSATTCALVRMRPSGRMMDPDPMDSPENRPRPARTHMNTVHKDCMHGIDMALGPRPARTRVHAVHKECTHHTHTSNRYSVSILYNHTVL